MVVTSVEEPPEVEWAQRPRQDTRAQDARIMGHDRPESVVALSGQDCGRAPAVRRTFWLIHQGLGQEKTN